MSVAADLRTGLGWVKRVAWRRWEHTLVVLLVVILVFLELVPFHTLWMLVSWVKYEAMQRVYGTYPYLLHRYFFPSLCVFGIFGWFLDCPWLYSWHFILCNLYKAYGSNAGSQVQRGPIPKWKIKKNPHALAWGEGTSLSDEDADQDKVRKWMEGRVPAKVANCTCSYEVSLWVNSRGNSLGDQHWEGLLEVTGQADQKIVRRVFQLSRRTKAGAVTCLEDKAVEKKWPPEREPGQARGGDKDTWARTGYNTKLWWTATRKYTAAEAHAILMAGMQEGQKPGGVWEKFPKPGSSSTNCGSYCLRVMIVVLEKAVQGTWYSLLPPQWLMLCMTAGASWRTKNGSGLYVFGVLCAAVLPFPMGDVCANLASGLECMMKRKGWTPFNVLTLVDRCLVFYVAVCNLPLMFGLCICGHWASLLPGQFVGLFVNTGR